MSTTLQVNHACAIAVNFKFVETLSRLNNFHRGLKTLLLERSEDGCVKCQQNKDEDAVRLTSPGTLKLLVQK